MNKLIHSEIMKHIKRSIIKQDFYDCYSPENEQKFRVINPLTRMTLCFSRTNYSTHVEYTIEPHHDELNKIFSKGQRKQLFEFVEKRYETHFKNQPIEIREFYKKLLVSNNIHTL